MNVNVKMVLFPVRQKFNTFNTFTSFDLVAFGHRAGPSAVRCCVIHTRLRDAAISHGGG